MRRLQHLNCKPLVQMVSRASFIAFLGIGLWANWAEAAPPSRVDPSARPGYLQSLENERETADAIEVVLPPRPAETAAPLSQRIFNRQLTKEFQDSYRQAFGQTEAEQNYNQPSRITTANMESGPTSAASEEDERRRAFGEYMLRRLAEYHLDNYAKNDPQVRPAWELKERLSQVNAEVAPGYKVNGKYSISGNFFELKLENPFIRSRATYEFGGNGPSQEREITYYVGRDLTDTIALDSLYRSNRGQIALIGTKGLSPGLTASLTGSSTTRRTSEGWPGEKLILAGLAWNY